MCCIVSGIGRETRCGSGYMKFRREAELGCGPMLNFGEASSDGLTGTWQQNISDAVALIQTSRSIQH